MLHQINCLLILLQRPPLTSFQIILRFGAHRELLERTPSLVVVARSGEEQLLEEEEEEEEEEDQNVARIE